MPIDDHLLEAEEHMEKAIEHLHHELRGVRTGRPSAARESPAQQHCATVFIK